MADFITLAEYKKYKDIKRTNKDSRITVLIPQVSAFIKTQTKRTFIDYYGSPAKVEYFDSNLDTVYPREFPIVGTPVVEYSTDGGVIYAVMTENTDYFIDEELGSIYSGTDGLSLNVATNKHKSLKVTYNGGYLTTPEEIKLLSIMLLDYFTDEQYIESKSINTSTLTTFPPNKLPVHIRQLLGAHRELL